MVARELGWEGAVMGCWSPTHVMIAANGSSRATVQSRDRRCDNLNPNGMLHSLHSLFLARKWAASCVGALAARHNSLSARASARVPRHISQLLTADSGFLAFNVYLKLRSRGQCSNS